MRTHLFYVIIIVSTLISCEQENIEQEVIISEIELAFVYQDSKIDTIFDRNELTLAASHTGDQLVFSYFFHNEHSKYRLDDEYVQELFFEIAPRDTIFEFTNNLLDQTKPVSYTHLTLPTICSV